MKSDQKNVSAASVARKEAGWILAVHGNRLLLILGILTVLSSVMLYILLQSTLSYLVSVLGRGAADHTVYLLGESTYLVLAFLLTLFFVLPLLYGLPYIASKLAFEEDAVLADVLVSFSSKNAYRKALRFAWGTLPRFTCFAIVVGWTFQYAQVNASSSFLPALGMAFLILFELVAAFAFCAKDFFAIYFLYRTPVSAKEARRQSRRLTQHCRAVAYRYTVDYLPWLLLSFVTLGTLFVADTLPRMLISYFRLCKATNEMIIQSEETDYE